MRLLDKVTLITGGNSGIGLGIVLLAVQEGATVVIAARNPERGAQAVQLAQQAGGQAYFVQADLRSEPQVQNVIARTLAQYGRLDVVINNAGAGAQKSGVQTIDGPSTRWEKLINANLTATYLVSAYAMPEIRKVGGGAIVNISSTAAVHGNYGIYGAAKAGVEGLTRSLAVEYAPYQIRVNCVSPGWIKTDVTYPTGQQTAEAAAQREAWEKTTSLLGRMGQPTEIAQAVVFLASAQASFITGATLVVDGGLTIIDPTAQSWLAQMGPDTFASQSHQTTNTEGT